MESREDELGIPFSVSDCLSMLSSIVSALQIAREVRAPGTGSRGPSKPPVFMTLPTTIARRAVTLYHQAGRQVALEYVGESKLAAWAGSRHRSLASSASNVIDGVSAYITADQGDGRTVLELGRETVIALPSGPVKARIDVVLEDSGGLVGRVVFWDGPGFQATQVPLLAAPFSEAMRRMYPQRTISSIAVWQGRRQIQEETSFNAAQRRLPRANQIAASL